MRPKKLSDIAQIHAWFRFLLCALFLFLCVSNYSTRHYLAALVDMFFCSWWLNLAWRDLQVADRIRAAEAVAQNERA